MKNRKLILIVSLVLALTMSLGGTLAYLTDTDADVNTMVLGNVKIEQNEYQRVKDENGQYTTAVEPYVDGQMLLPAVYERVDANGNKVNDPARTQGVVVGDYTLKIGMRTFPNYIDKIVNVTNTGNTDAWVRTLIAAPVGIKPDGTNDGTEDNSISDQFLHLNQISSGDTAPASGWYYSNNGEEYPEDYKDHYIVKAVELFGDGNLYDVTVVTNINKLAAGKHTGPNLVGLYVDNDVDYMEDGYYAKNPNTNEMVKVWNGTDVKVLVLTQAVQAKGFNDPWTAFANTFGEVTAAKAQEWFGDVVYVEPEEPEANEDGVYEISTAAELFGFANMVNEGNSFAGKTVKLTADITLTKEWKPVGQTEGYGAATYFQGTFDGQGHTIYNMTITETNEGGNYAAGFFGFIDAGKATIKNVNFDNATVNGHHWTAVVVGYMTGVVDNCHVTNSTVTCTHANDDACGDKAGTIVGYINSGAVKNCSATNCTVRAGRDAGQLVGCNTVSAHVTDCTATNVVVSATCDCTGANIKNEIVGRE